MAGGLSPRVFHQGTRARLTGQPRLCERIEVVRNASDGDGNFNDCVVVCTMTASRPPEVMSFRIDHPGSRRKHRVSYKAKAGCDQHQGMRGALQHDCLTR